MWTYSESIDALNNENRASLNQRKSAIDFVLADTVANIDQGLREIRDTSSLVEHVIQGNAPAARDILIQFSEAMDTPALDVIFIQLWDGSIFANTTSPFFDLSESLTKLGQKTTPSMDKGGLVDVNQLSFLVSSEPLLHHRTGQVIGRIIGGTVLNNNLTILDTIHALTKSNIVVLVSDGKAISSTAPLDSEVVIKLSMGTTRDDAGSKPHLDPDFGKHLIAGFIPISIAGTETSLVVATAVSDATYTLIRNAYRLHIIMLLLFSAVAILFTILLVRIATQSSLGKLLSYARSASAEETRNPYQRGMIEEFNTLGQAMEVMVEKINSRTEKLAETTNQLELAMQGGRIGLWDWDIRSGKAAYGHIWAEILRLDFSEITDEYAFWEDRIHPDDRNGLIAEINRCRRGETSFFLRDHRLRTKDGEWVWVAARGAVSERDEDNLPIRMTGIIVDITQRRRAEAGLKDSRHRYRVIFENSPLGMVHFNADGSILDCNERFIDLMGSSRDALIGFEAANKTTEKMNKVLKAALRGSPSIYEDRYTSVTGGKTTYLRGIFSPVQIGVSPTEVIATFEDISRRMSAESDLKRTRRLLEDAQRLGNLGAWEYDVASEDTTWTDNLYRIFGYEPGELESKQQFFTENIVHPDDRRRLSEAFNNILSLRKTVSAHFKIIRKDGQVRHFQGVAAPQVDFSGKVTRIYGVNQDITALKEAEDEIMRAKADVHSSDDTSLRFLIADNDEEYSQAIQGHLKMIGHRATTVTNGQEVLDALRSMDFDMIIMDENIPVMNGIAATAIIRSGELGEGKAEVPIIGLTASSMAGDKERLIEAGMDGHASKPIDLDALMTTIHELTSKK